MTEEKNTITTEGNTPATPNTGAMSGATVPSAGGNKTPVDNTAENNSLAVQEANYPGQQNTAGKTLHAEQTKDARTLTAEELKAKRYQSGLTVEEAKKLEDLEAENNNEGKLSQENQKDIPYREIKQHKLEEGDIIEVMYKGLLNDTMAIDAWARKHFWHAYDKMMYNSDKKNNERIAAQKAEKEKTENQQTQTAKDAKTQNDTFDLNKAYYEKHETIKTEMDQNLSKVKDISQAINKGTLFDKNNKNLMNDFKEMTKNDKETYEAIKHAFENKDNKEARENMSKEFFAYNAGTIWFNFINQNTANDLAYAEVSHKSKHSNMSAKQMEKEFTSSRASYQDNIQKATAQEQQKAKEKISKSPLLNDKVLSKINLSELYENTALKTKNMSQMGQKAVDFAQLNSNTSERNPYLNGARHMVGIPQISRTEHVFEGGTLKDAINYMKELRAETMESTASVLNRDNYNRDMVSNHINRLKSASSNKELLKQLRDRNSGR